MSDSNSKLADPAVASPSNAAAAPPGPSGGAAVPATGRTGRPPLPKASKGNLRIIPARLRTVYAPRLKPKKYSLSPGS